MKRFFALVLALGVCLFSVTALAEGKLTVTEKNLIEFEGSSNAYFFAKVENTGDAAIGVGAGKLVGFSSDDDVLVSESYVTANPSSVILQPGESLYVSDSIWESVLETADIADFKFSMDTEDYASEVTFVPCEATLEMKDEYDSYVYVTLTNNTDAIQYGPYVTVALHDQEGNLVYVRGQYADSLGVHPGSTVTIRVYIDSDFIRYFQTNNIEISTADAYVCYEAE